MSRGQVWRASTSIDGAQRTCTSAPGAPVIRRTAMGRHTAATAQANANGSPCREQLRNHDLRIRQVGPDYDPVRACVKKSFDGGRSRPLAACRLHKTTRRKTVSRRFLGTVSLRVNASPRAVLVGVSGNVSARTRPAKRSEGRIAGRPPLSSARNLPVDAERISMALFTRAQVARWHPRAAPPAPSRLDKTSERPGASPCTGRRGNMFSSRRPAMTSWSRFAPATSSVSVDRSRRPRDAGKARNQRSMRCRG